MKNKFKQCPNGHYYQGKECPFCKWMCSGCGKFYPKMLGWNGKKDCCENCGNIIMTTQLYGKYDTYAYKNDDDCSKFTRIKVSEMLFSGPDGEGVLAGVEIETCIKRFDGTPRNVQKIFLSTNELKHLIDILKDSPILQQQDRLNF